MTITRNMMRALLAAIVSVTVWSAQGSSASASEPGERGCSPQESASQESASRESASTVSSESRDALALLRIECPLLAGIVEKFALLDLGEGFSGASLSSQSGELVAVAAVPASEDIEVLRSRAVQALQAGGSQFELKEMLYLTAINAGVPRAIEVTRALSDLLVQQTPAPVVEPAFKCSELTTDGATRHF